VDIVEIQARQFCVADAASIEQFHDGLVARRPACRVILDRIHHAIHLLD
jgi:hypothetical protein